MHSFILRIGYAIFKICKFLRKVILLGIKENYEDILSRAKKACEKSGRDFSDVLILGVSKTVDADTLIKARDMGIKTLGENRVQELLEKCDKVENVKWHLIGHLQTNKVKYIIDKVELIHSVESIKLLSEISKQAKKIGKVQKVLIEVNVSGEESKFGIKPEEICTFLEEAKNFDSVLISGFMTMAPLDAQKDEIRRIFKNLYKIYIDIKQKKYDNIDMKYLSMGMSNDFEIALEEGANIVRVGRALFKR